MQNWKIKLTLLMAMMASMNVYAQQNVEKCHIMIPNGEKLVPLHVGYIDTVKAIPLIDEKKNGAGLQIVASDEKRIIDIILPMDSKEDANIAVGFIYGMAAECPTK